MKLRNLVAICLVLVCNIADAQLTAPNIDFETGTLSNWLYYTGTCCPIVTPRGTAPVTSRHTRTSGTATDYYGGFPIVSPTGGSYSLRLGNSNPGGDGDRARYIVHIPTGSTSYSFIYHYAVVLEDAGHGVPGQPRMEIKAYDSLTGTVIPCDSFNYVANSSLPGFIASTFATDVYYLPWKTGTLDFSGYGGHTIAIDFATGDCGYGGHFGYGYVDMTAGLYANRILLCAGATTATLTGPAGYASYRWCDSATLSITYDTTQNTTVTAPSISTTYALIVTPYPGYGCTDTLYTQVVPPCSGTPSAGYANYIPAPLCGYFDQVFLSGYISACGDSYQWQSSPDSITWTNISGATSANYFFYTPTTATYYRCVITCSYSGLTGYSSHVYVPGLAVTLTNNIIPDSLCSGAHFYLSTCGPSAYYNVTTYFGDGSSFNIPLATTRPNDTDFIHNYAYPGTYTIKQVLYDGTLPVDSLLYTYNYIYCSTIPLSLYYDNDSDCTFSTGDMYLHSPVNIRVDSNGIAIDTLSVTSGIYYLTYGGPGTIYAFTIISPPAWMSFTCPSTGTIYDTILPTITRYPTKYFGTICTPGAFDLSEHAVTRPAFVNGSGDIYINNITTCNWMGALVTLTFSPKYTFGRSWPTPMSISGNVVTWNIPVLSGPSRIHYAIPFNPAIGPLTPGDTVQTKVTISPIAGDIDSLNNYEEIIDTVLNSCDPNMIKVNPTGCLASGVLPNDMRYTIDFENIGNDTARNVFLLDTLSDHLDPSTIQIIDASATMYISTYTRGIYNIVKFDFPGINLLDSSHHDECHGMVMYTIKTRPGLSLGTNIMNRVGIYFDINPVVMTNEVNNVIGCPMYSLDIAETTGNKMQLYPNPAKDELIVKMSSTMNGTLEVTNQVGQVLIKQSMNGAQAKLNIKSLPAGIYFLSATTTSGKYNSKFTVVK